MAILVSILAAALAVAALVIIAQVVVIVKLQRRTNARAMRADKVVIKDDVRYGTDKQVVDAHGKTQVTHLPDDLVLQSGRTYKVTKTGKVLPGQYTVLAADESGDSFTLKVGGVVKEYHHQDTIVLADGDTISPRSGNVILR